MQDLIQAVLADVESDPTSLQPLKNAFKKLLQTHRAFKNAEQEVTEIWKPFPNQRVCVEFQKLRSQDHDAYVQASSLLKLTAHVVDGGNDEVTTKPGTRNPGR